MPRLVRAAGRIAMALAVSGGCRSGVPRTPGDSSGGRAQAAASQPRSQDEIVKTLAQVMDRDVFTHPSDYRSRDTLVTCSPDHAPERTVALATYHIVDIREFGDSALAAIQVRTVERQVPSDHVADRFDASFGVRTDTIHQLMVRSAGLWKVCGAPREEMGFVHGGQDSQTEWSPRGITWADVRRAVDSLRTVETGSHAPPRGR